VTGPPGPPLPAEPAAPATPPPVRGSYRTVVRNRRYLIYQSSAIASSTGYAVYSVAIPWLAYQNSGSFLVVGLVLFVETGLYSLTFLVAPFVDRAADKRRIFQIGYPIQAAAAVALALASARGDLGLPLLLGLVALLAILWDFEWAVFQVAPRLLLDRDELFAAQGLSSAFGGGAVVGGYAAGAAILLVAGPASAGFLYAGLLAVGTVLASVVPLRSPVRSVATYSTGFREGWRYLVSEAGRPLLQLGALDVVAGFFTTAPAILITLFAQTSFPDRALAYGALFTAYVVGGVAVDLVLGQLNPRRRVGYVLIGGLAVAAASLFLAGLAPPSLLAALVAWAAAGAALGAYASSKYTFQWGYVPADRLARVTGNLYLFAGTSGAVGSIVLGVLAGHWPPVELISLVAAVFAAAAVVSVTLPAVRHFRF
jgi:Transmembrane secretion effector